MPETPKRKRLPGDANPTPTADGPNDVARLSFMSNAHGDGGYGVVLTVAALLAWVKRRRAIKRR